MFFLLQGKPRTEPIEVFCDSGANLWFAVEWDVPISPQARNLWLQNFDMMEKVRGLMYPRNGRPSDALSQTCRLWVVVDAAEWGLILSVYVGWERAGGGNTCTHLYAMVSWGKRL